MEGQMVDVKGLEAIVTIKRVHHRDGFVRVFWSPDANGFLVVLSRSDDDDEAQVLARHGSGTIPGLAQTAALYAAVRFAVEEP